MTKKRYNAKIQRAKGLLEIAAAMYETSLSFQTTRAAERVLQTESRVGGDPGFYMSRAAPYPIYTWSPLAFWSGVAAIVAGLISAC